MLELEDKLARGKMNGEELLALVPQLTSFERGELGMFIGMTMEPEPYAAAFFECWYDIPQEGIKRLVKKFIEEEPENAFLLAPNVSRLFTLREHGWDMRGRKKESDPVFRWEDIYKFEQFGRNFLNAHPFSFSQEKMLLEYAIRSDDRYFAATLFAHLKNKPAVLLPYLPRLAEMKVTDKKTMDEWMDAHVFSGSTFYTDFFCTPEESTERERIKTEVKQKHPDFILDLDFTATRSRLPHDIQSRWDAINKRARQRGSDHLFSSWQELSSLMDAKKRERLLLHLQNSGIPIFLKVGSWARDGLEVRTVLRHVEMNSSMMSCEEIHALVESGYGSEAMRYLLADISIYHADSDLMVDLVKRWDRARTWFPREDAKRIEETITRECPDAWARRMDVALKERILPLSKIADGLQKCGTSALLSHYEELRHYANRQPPISEAVDISPDQLKEMAREAVKNEPEYFLTRKAFVQQLFSEKEKMGLLREWIANSKSKYFFSEAIKEIVEDPQWVGLRGEMASRLEKDAETFVYLCDVEDFERSHLRQLLGEKKFEELVLRFLPQMRFTDYVDTGKIEWFFIRSRRADALLRMFEKEERMDDAINVAKKVEWNMSQEIKKSRDQEIKKMAKETEITEGEEWVMEKYFQKLLGLIQRWGEKDPWFYFEHLNALRIKNLPANAAPWDQATSFLREHPEEVNKMVELAPKERLPELARNNIVPVAFHCFEGYYPSGNVAFPEDVVEQIIKINPFVRVEYQRKRSAFVNEPGFFDQRDTYQGDYYDEMLRECRGARWYPLVSEALEKTARDEQEKNGEQRRINAIYVPKLFRENVKRMAVLEAEPLLETYREEVLALPKDERARIAALLEMAVMHHWIWEEERAEHWTLQALIARLETRMRKFFAGRFQISETEVAAFDYPLELLAAFLEYYSSRACKKDPELQQMLREIIACGDEKKYADWKMWGDHRGTWNVERGSSNEMTGKEGALKAMQEKGWLPKSVSLEAYGAWVKDERMELQEILKWDVEDIGHGLRRVLDQAVADHHLPAEILQTNEARMEEDEKKLNAPLFDLQERLGELQGKMKTAKAEKREFAEAEEYGALQAEIALYRGEHTAEMSRLKALRFIKHLPHLTTQELEKKSFIIEKKVTPWMQAFKIMEEGFRADHPEFLQDIARIKEQLYAGFEQMFGGARVSRETLEVTDRTDLETAFMIGEKPVASCQSYKSGGSMNAGLLSFVADPNVKIIQVRNEQGRIIARAALRLLEDDAGHPALFLERIYSTNPHPAIGKAIRAFAKQKGERMSISPPLGGGVGGGVVLYSHSAEGAEDVEGAHERATLVNIASRAPYVYTDAGGGLVKGGKFEIKGAVRM